MNASSRYSVLAACAVLAVTLAAGGCAAQAPDAGEQVPETVATTTAPSTHRAASDRYLDDAGRVRVGLIAMPYSGARNVPEISGGPVYLANPDLDTLLDSLETVRGDLVEVALTPEEDDDYGEWHRLGMANAHLGAAVRDNETAGRLTVGLLSNCSSLMGVLGGLQDAGATDQPLQIGLVFIDAHGDFNTPETTLSGMLGGMPVAVSAGMCLRNLRLESGLDPALSTDRIVMGGVRDLDPLERELVDGSAIQHVTVEDMRGLSENLDAQMQRLSETSDLIYVHIDMDVLDPAEVPGHPLTVADGPTSAELGGALRVMFRYPKVAALGLASTPWGERDPDGVSRAAAHTLIAGALAGVRER